jgi:hypothetical protein
MYLDSKGKRKMSFIIGSTITLALLLLAIVLPEARITVTVEKRIFKKTYQITLKQHLEKTLFALDTIPAYPVGYTFDTKKPPEASVIADLNLSVTKKDLTDFILTKIQAEIQSDERIKPENIAFTLDTADKEKILVNVYVEAITSKTLDYELLKKQIQGKKIAEAQELVLQEPNIKNFQISLTPSWLFFIPLIKERIVIIEK